MTDIAAAEGALAALGWPVERLEPVAGGDICRAFRLQCRGQTVFAKWRADAPEGFFAAEADGLRALAATRCVRVPAVLAVAEHWLLLEWLPLVARDHRADAAFGRALASLHGQACPRFGWHRDNFIGRMPQENRQCDEWAEFFVRSRLAPQLRWLASGPACRAVDGLGARLLTAARRLLGDHHPHPALVHGDLWSGNAAALADHEPVLFDPAVHWADRECDLAMATLFGGFSDAFWKAYLEASPLPDGAEERRPVYQLYHVLNHANLFGGGYVERARRTTEELVARAG